MADVLILCCGSRGDTEPWARLAAGLRESGLRVALAAHGEYEQLAAAIAGPDVPFREVRGSLPRALVESPEGAALRARTGLGALAAFRDLMVPLAQLWLEDALAATKEFRPKLILATSMHYIGGAWLIPELIKREREGRLKPRPDAGAAGAAASAPGTGGAHHEGGDWDPAGIKLVVGHTVLSHVTGTYLPATCGLGSTLPFAFLNRLMWRVGLGIADKNLYRPLRAATVERFGLDPPPPTWLENEQGKRPPTIYVYSSALVPRPRDWPAAAVVTGPLLGPDSRASPLGPAAAEQAEAAAQLPEGLRAYIAAAKRAGRPVVYVGLGSMLGAYFDNPPEILKVLAEGVAQAQAGAGAGKGFAAVVHTVTGARGEHEAMPPPPEGSDLFWLDRPVPHSALLPLVDLTVHHGGMGTTHAAAVAGRPAIIVPVSLASDQVFWADIIRRRGAGVASPQHAGALTAASFAQLLQKALGALPVLAAAAARLAEGVRAEPDGVGAAVGALRRVMAGEAIGKGLPAPAQAAA